MTRRWAGVAAALAMSGALSALDPGIMPVAAAPARSELRAVPAAARPVAPVPAPPRKIDCRKRKCVALTFDDGPMPSTTKLLKTLAQKKVRATFFLIGQNVKKKPQIARAELAGGHELGNHSYTHTDLSRASASRVKSELSKTQSAIKKATGVTPKLMRPPYGATDSTVASVTRKMKLAQIIWAVDPNDWRDRNSKTVERRVVSATRPGYIVLMHDIHPTTVAAVPNIIKRLAAKGYVFVTVSELFGKPLTPGKKYSKR
ncbi:polysaccharide deacetylase family protein [Spirillospora sp. NPDC048911]|uniref:polysaccharide deacetylase family protein n=1 Tax=Spirillospora sp. NPDC048911 TaxID=3364527 RepID=UPI00370F8771